MALLDVGEYKEVENRGVFYQYKQSLQKKTIAKDLNVIYDSILQNCGHDAPQEMATIVWEHNPVTNKLRSSVFVKKGSYREPSEVSSIYDANPVDSECSLEDSGMLAHGYDVPARNQALLT